MLEINPYVGEFEGRRSVPSMGGVGVRTPTFHAYRQKSKFGIADQFLQPIEVSFNLSDQR
jgi:hypothetical protein